MNNTNMTFNDLKGIPLSKFSVSVINFFDAQKHEKYSVEKLE